MNENLLQVTKYWILNDRLPYTLNWSMQARRSTIPSKHNKLRNTTLLIKCLFIQKAQQREDVRVKVSMYTHTQLHKYSNNNCTSLHTAIHGTQELLFYIAIKQQCCTSCTIHGSVTVEWRLRCHSSTGVSTVHLRAQGWGSTLFPFFLIKITKI